MYREQSRYKNLSPLPAVKGASVDEHWKNKQSLNNDTELFVDEGCPRITGMIGH